MAYTSISLTNEIAADLRKLQKELEASGGKWSYSQVIKKLLEVYYAREKK